MDYGVLIRLFMGTLFGLVWAFALTGHDDRERSEEDAPESPRYRAYMFNALLPIFVLMLVIVGPVSRGLQWTFETMLSMLFNVFLHIGAFYVILCLLNPVLRRYISARVCAALWLVPNYLYIMSQESMELPNPVFVWYLPNRVVNILAVVWGAGFAGILGWKVFSHFRFRRRILRYAREVEDSTVLEVWHKEQRRAGYPNTPYRLVRSAEVSTPLTIGFYKWSIRVVLPERSYTPEELSLIFRHELVHIGRDDAGTKFFLVFCTAMCWFNPLMWWAMARSAEDLELSCDETVLLDAETRTRKQYAELILTTAGDERGFTTCLSASAKSLRYRLKHIMAPRKKEMGYLVAGAVFCLLITTCGYTALAYESVPGTEAVFGGNDLSGYTIQSVHWKAGGEFEYYQVSDEQALRSYLAGLDFYKVTGNYAFDSGDRCLGIRYLGPDGRTWFDLTDKGLSIYRPDDGKLKQYQYACRDVNWDFLGCLLIKS